MPETPYVKLITQLFGETIVIANATGSAGIAFYRVRACLSFPDTLAAVERPSRQWRSSDWLCGKRSQQLIISSGEEPASIPEG